MDKISDLLLLFTLRIVFLKCFLCIAIITHPRNNLQKILLFKLEQVKLLAFIDLFGVGV